MATNTLYFDTNKQNKNFLFSSTVNSTPTLRAYIFEDGSEVTLTADDEAKFYYAYGREADTYTTVNGSANVGSNFIDFDFSSTDTSSSGKYFASIAINVSSTSKSIIQQDGMFILKKNPAI